MSIKNSFITVKNRFFLISKTFSSNIREYVKISNIGHSLCKLEIHFLLLKAHKLILIIEKHKIF